MAGAAEVEIGGVDGVPGVGRGVDENAPGPETRLAREWIGGRG